MKSNRDMPTAEQKRLRDMYEIMTVIRNLGPLREPEIVAAVAGLRDRNGAPIKELAGLDENRVYSLCKHLVERGYLARRACDGELSFPVQD